MKGVITSNRIDMIEFGKWYRMAIIQKSLAINEPIENMVDMFYKSKNSTHQPKDR